jgi:small-conductance mechanosensitive channel
MSVNATTTPTATPTLSPIHSATGIPKLINDALGIGQIPSEIITAIIMFALVAVIGWVAYFIFEHYFSAWAKKTETKVDDDILANVKSVAVLLIILIGMYNALTSLTFTQQYKSTIYDIFTVAGILLIAFASTRVSNIVVDWYTERQTKKGRTNHHLMFILKKIMQFIILFAALLVILWALGIDLTGAVVGLGVGGIAIALAVQNTLSDVLSAFSIYFDKPFEIGDFIIIGSQAGTVTNIGMRSTRIKLLQGEELVISNKELTSTQVRNFKKLEKRRVVFTVGVEYNTPIEKLKKIPDMIKAVIDAQELAKVDRVHFAQFGDFSLKFEVVYYVQVSDYTKYMDVQQAINFGVKEAFEREGIKLALPTQILYIKDNNVN